MDDWGKCPVCKSRDITGGQLGMEYGEVYQWVKCLECNSRWTEIYHQAKRIEIEDGTKPGKV